jgi:hypothetical protein
LSIRPAFSVPPTLGERRVPDAVRQPRAFRARRWQCGRSEKEETMSDTNEGTGTASGDDRQQDGLGPEGTIPSGSDGVGVGTGDQSHFEPEEDPEAAAAEPDAGVGHA